MHPHGLSGCLLGAARGFHPLSCGPLWWSWGLARGQEGAVRTRGVWGWDGQGSVLRALPSGHSVTVTSCHLWASAQPRHEPWPGPHADLDGRRRTVTTRPPGHCAWPTGPGLGGVSSTGFSAVPPDGVPEDDGALGSLRLPSRWCRHRQRPPTPQSSSAGGDRPPTSVVRQPGAKRVPAAGACAMAGPVGVPAGSGWPRSQQGEAGAL